MKALIITAALVAGGLTAPAHAGSCLLDVGGERIMTGACETKVGPREIMIRQPGGGEAATVRVDAINSSRGFAIWNARGDRGRPEDEWLGPVSRDGDFCWRGSRVRLCAWGP